MLRWAFCVGLYQPMYGYQARCSSFHTLPLLQVLYASSILPQKMVSKKQQTIGLSTPCAQICWLHHAGSKILNSSMLSSRSILIGIPLKQLFLQQSHTCSMVGLHGTCIDTIHTEHIHLKQYTPHSRYPTLVAAQRQAMQPVWHKYIGRDPSFFREQRISPVSNCFLGASPKYKCDICR